MVEHRKVNLARLMHTAINSLSLGATIILQTLGAVHDTSNINHSSAAVLMEHQYLSKMYVKFSIVFRMMRALIDSSVMLSFYINAQVYS